jgi:hypothetical protein
METLRGIWKCRTESLNRGKQNRAYIHVRTGHIHEPRRGCGSWNVYVSTVPIEVDAMNSFRRKIDLRCIKCGRRVKFMPKRKTARGRQRPITWFKRPTTEPVHALRKEARARNALDEKEALLLASLESGDISESDLPGFSQASQIVE